jgi:hypothetical protein
VSATTPTQVQNQTLDATQGDADHFRDHLPDVSEPNEFDRDDDDHSDRSNDDHDQDQGYDGRDLDRDDDSNDNGWGHNEHRDDEDFGEAHTDFDVSDQHGPDDTDRDDDNEGDDDFREPLRRGDILHLHASGLTDATIAASGFFRGGDADNRRLLNWPTTRPGNAAGLVVQYPNANGYAKVRFDEPPVLPGQSTKPIRGGPHGEDFTYPSVRTQKYGSPAGVSAHIYLPSRDLCPCLSDPKELLIITEGEKKAVLLAQEGYAAVGLPGVCNWHDVEARKSGWDDDSDERPVHPELLQLLLDERPVALVFDAPDMDGDNPEVIRQAAMLAKAIQKKGHEVFIIYVPHKDGEKTGVDDYFVRKSIGGEGGIIERLVDRRLPALPSKAVHVLHERQRAGNKLGPIHGRRLLCWARAWIGPGRPLTHFARDLVRKKLVNNDEVRRFLEAVETSRDRSGPTEFPALCDVFRNDKKRLIACERHGALEMDERTLEILIGRAPFGSDTDLSAARERIARSLRPKAFQKRFDFRQREIGEALACVAAERKFHPVQEYLHGLVWDGAPRIGRLLDSVLNLDHHGPDFVLNLILLRRWFISAVARALKPGCKVDTVLILQGKQGVLKSTFFSTLVGPWFTDSPIDVDNKDGMLLLGKYWIVEWPELQSMFRARDQNTVKAFVSSQRDSFRPPYGRTTVEVPRSSIFVGTTNEEDFLTDDTGNRRYWVIGGCDQRFDLDRLTQWRDQLWAEAVAAYKGGEQWWLTPEEETLLTSRLADYERHDPWDERIKQALANEKALSASGVTTAGIMEKVLRLGIEHQNRGVQMRVASCLKRIGFVSRRVGNSRAWVRKP